MKKISAILVGIMLVVAMLPLYPNKDVVKASGVTVSYNTHIQDYGWLSTVSNGQLSGSTGQSKRLEAIQIKVSGVEGLGIKYKTHIQNIGWQDYKTDNQVSGTTGRSLRLEAIQIVLTGNQADNYDVYYQVHVQNYGWLGFAKNGEMSGTSGLSLRLEAIKIYVVPKGTVIQGTNTTASIVATTPYERHGRLSVKGTDLVDQSGNRFQLKGVSTHGLAWFPQYVTQDAFKTLRDGWGANLIRLANYTQEYNGYCTGDNNNRQRLENVIDTGVKATYNLGMYCIIDWHILSDGNPNIHRGEAIDFFNRMSAKYKNYGNVIYEICNEPNNVSWNEVKSYADAVIPVIRANSPNAIIIVGTLTWSQDVDQVAANPVNNPHNVMYAMHFYAATHGDYIRNKLITAHNANTPIFISEFSICDASGNGNIDYGSAEAWKNLIKQYNLSYAGWSLCNKNESSAIIKSSVSKTSNWTDSELSSTGLWLKHLVKG